MYDEYFFAKKWVWEWSSVHCSTIMQAVLQAVLQGSWFVERADHIFLDWFALCYLEINVWL